MPMTSWRWIQFHHNADASNWYGDSAAWMRAALREDAESGREKGKSGRDIDHHRLNVGLVSAGIAIELMYKVILVADRVEFKATHDIRTLHGLLEARKGRVEGILLEEGWPTVEAFLDFMDNDLRHADRKYWMSKPPRRGAVGFTIGIEIMTVPGLARVHRRMAALVDLRGLVAQYNLEHARVITTQALTRKPIVGHKAMATKCLEPNGQQVEYTVYESTGPGWHVPDYVRGWWEMPTESGKSTGSDAHVDDPSVLTHLLGQRIQPPVGIGIVPAVQGTAEEGVDHGVQLLADARDLALGDAFATEGLDQVLGGLWLFHRSTPSSSPDTTSHTSPALGAALTRFRIHATMGSQHWLLSFFIRETP